jgi:hypothetical protein
MPASFRIFPRGVDYNIYKSMIDFNHAVCARTSLVFISTNLLENFTSSNNNAVFVHTFVNNLHTKLYLHNFNA